MKVSHWFLNHAVAALLVTLVGLSASPQLYAQVTLTQEAETLDDLYARLRNAGPEAAQRIETEILTESSKSGSPAIDQLTRRGEAALEAGDAALAVDHLTAALDHAPGFTTARIARAQAYFSSGETGPALADLAQALDEEPRSFTAWASLGMILTEIGQEAEALKSFQAAAALHPHLADVNAAITELERKVHGRAL